MIAVLRRGGVAAVVTAVMAVHTAWIAAYVVTGHEVRDFIHLGLYWVTRSTVSDEIVVDPAYEYPQSRGTATAELRGYDGQFSYYIALDPRDARHYLDAPSYRYRRILYPMATWLLSAGSADVLPYAMVVVNWLAIAFGTIAVALLLRRRGASPWWAALFGLAPGMLLGLQRDLTEPLAYGLAAGGLLALAGEGRQRHLVAGVLFGLAALARQTTLLIPLVWVVWMLLGWERDAGSPLRARVGRAVVVGGLAVAPYLVWSSIVSSWLGPSPSQEPYNFVPFAWLFERDFELARHPPMAVAVVLPGVIALGCALLALWRGSRRPEWAALALQAAAFVVVAPAFAAYTSVGRAVLGVVLVGVLAIPFLDELPARARMAFAAAGALYMVMTPVVFVYGLTSFEV